MTDTKLLELLSNDIQTCNQLLELLEQEFAALNQRQLDTLQSLLDKKQPLLLGLQQNAAGRAALLQQSGHSNDLAGVQLFAKNSPLSATLLAQYSELGELIEQCQSANLRNGRLIRANQISVGSALNIVRGNHSEPALYDKSGSTAYKGTRRPFTSA